LWLSNPRVSGRAGSGQGRPSGIPHGYIRKTTREEVCSEGGGHVPDIIIPGATTFDVQLTSEKVVWTFFVRVAVPIELLGVTVESISTGGIGIRRWMGEQGAAVVVAAAERPHGNIEYLLVAHQDTKEKGVDWLFHGCTVFHPDSWIFLLTTPYRFSVK
jgi:hypothetical protein